MQRHPARLRNAPHGLDGVNAAMRIFRGRTQNHHGVFVDEAVKLGCVCMQLRIQRQKPKFHAEILSGLVPGHMCRGRQDHLRRCHPPLLASLVAVGFDRQQTAFSAT